MAFILGFISGIVMFSLFCIAVAKQYKQEKDN